MNPKQLKHAFSGSGYVCLAFGPGGLLLASNERGIAPLFTLCGLAHAGMPLYVADKVIGKAAALLCVRCGVRAVYADVMSRAAQAVLTAHKIDFACSQLVPRIQNRTGTGLCPMEQLAQDTDDPEEVYRRVGAFLQDLRKG